MMMDETDRKIINSLQDGIPICDRPFAKAAEGIGISEDELRRHLISLRDKGTITRIGPMYHAERLGGGLTLAAMRIPEKDFERVATQVNAFDEVAHNYERNHEFNMWFVLATEDVGRINEVLEAIEKETGYPVHNMPKLEEFYVGLKFDV